MRCARCLAAALLALAVGPGLAAGESDTADSVKAALVHAAGRGDPKALSEALDRAAALAGKDPSLPDLGAVADLVASLPQSVTSLSLVQVRVGWMYVTAKRGRDALGPLSAALSADPRNGIARSYLGEAKRQAGDPLGAADDLARAWADGADDAHVLPSVRKIVFDLRKEAPPAEGDAFPPYAVAAAKALAVKDVPDLRYSLATWLAFDADGLRGAPERVARLRSEAARHAAAVLANPGEAQAGALARLAYDAANWVRELPPKDVPDRFELLCAAVRLGGLPEGDAHEVPEALAALAEEALAKGRFSLAERMARRRLAMSDSPAARRVLLALPPDLGE